MTVVNSRKSKRAPSAGTLAFVSSRWASAFVCPKLPEEEILHRRPFRSHWLFSFGWYTSVFISLNTSHQLKKRKLSRNYVPVLNWWLYLRMSSCIACSAVCVEKRIKISAVYFVAQRLRAEKWIWGLICRFKTRRNSMDPRLNNCSIRQGRSAGSDRTLYLTSRPPAAREVASSDPSWW